MDCMAHGVAKSRAHLSDFHFELPNSNSVKRLPWWLSGKESTCQCRRLRFDSLGLEDPLEKGMATHSSFLAWEIPWTEETEGATVHGVTEELDTT